MYIGVEREYTKKEETKANKNKITVPNVIGKDSKKSIETLTAKGLKYKIQPEVKSDNSFVIKDQYPKAGTKVSKGTRIYIYSE